MKVVFFNEHGYVTNVFNDVYDPEIDKNNNIIMHNNGKIYGIKDDDINFIVVDDDVEIRPFEVIPNEVIEEDKTDDYEKSLGDKIKDGLEDIKEEVEEFFDGDDNDANKRDFLDDDEDYK